VREAVDPPRITEAVVQTMVKDALQHTCSWYGIWPHLCQPVFVTVHIGFDNAAPHIWMKDVLRADSTSTAPVPGSAVTLLDDSNIYFDRYYMLHDTQSSGHVLDVFESGSIGAELGLWPAHGGPNQEFLFVDHGNDTVSIRPRHEPELCVEVHDVDDEPMHASLGDCTLMTGKGKRQHFQLWRIGTGNQRFLALRDVLPGFVLRLRQRERPRDIGIATAQTTPTVQYRVLAFICVFE
jgi:hypothetical protein